MLLEFLGEFSFLFSDLVTPRGRRPIFAQAYTLTPEDAIQLREENLSSKMNPAIKHKIIETLETVMRENPFGETFVTAGAMIEESKQQNNTELPRFQVYCCYTAIVLAYFFM